MKTREFFFDLPAECIAQSPAQKRDESRMLVYDRADKSIADRRFFDLVEYLQPGDCLVLNSTKVLPARLMGKAEKTGGRMGFLLLRRTGANHWETLVHPGRRAKPGARFVFGDELVAEIESITEDGNRVVRFEFEGDFYEVLERVGQTPLPPYITNNSAPADRYQTVYAKHEGSVAAPTAGLHFTPALLDSQRAKGVAVAELVLHVGLGTFRPVKAENIEDHHMHSEYYEVSETAAETIKRAKAQGGRIVCVGTTSCRTLESVWTEDGPRPGSGMTNIFISPGYKFKGVDVMITNFHLPESTLLMLVSAFMGKDEAMRAYRHAIESGYRFYSYGDAMLIL